MERPDRGLYSEGLTIGYDSDLIKKITMEVVPGKITTLIGPNGCGKSTLLKTVSGQLKSRGGTVYVDGTEYAGMSARDAARKMAVVMTAPVKPELMTCREVIETGRYPYTGMLGILSDEDKKTVEKAIQVTNTVNIADNRFTDISDGQKQRVLLARAICQEPEILVLDEPTSYLDIKYRLDILGRIRELAAKDNIAVLMSLHELDIAMRLSDTVIALGDGEVKMIGTPEEVFKEDFIRKLFGIEGADMSLVGSVPWFA